MKVVSARKLERSERHVECPNSGFTSIRMLLESDGMGFSMTETTVHPDQGWQMWHYKNHLEACFCIEGYGILRDEAGNVFEIEPGTLYALDKNDKHYFLAKERVVLVCVFNPPLKGREVHKEDGSYE